MLQKQTLSLRNLKGKEALPILLTRDSVTTTEEVVLAQEAVVDLEVLHSAAHQAVA
jgi:hypothetical protein